jgi:MFS family permease
MTHCQNRLQERLQERPREWTREQSPTPDESSPRYAGWRVVAACFAVAMFCWGFGLYSHGIYLVELRQQHGWPAATISAAATAYYLLTASLVIFVNEAIASLGPRRVLLIGTGCLAGAVVMLAFIDALWQLYLAYMVMAFGSAAMHVGAITNILGLWFDRQRALAISLALNGASSGGILVAPVLVLAIAAVGFAPTMIGAAAIMAAILVPVIVLWVDRPNKPALRAGEPKDTSHATAAHWTRAKALRSPAFWSVAAPFALALLAQVGFFVHQIALLEPSLGRTGAGLAVGVLTIAAVIGRVVLGALASEASGQRAHSISARAGHSPKIGSSARAALALRLDLRLATALMLLGQVVALFTMTQTTNAAALYGACVLFGLAAGNLTSLPAVIIQREFEAASFGMLIGLSTAIGQFTYAFGPGLLGVIRDVTGGYGAALALCMVLEIVAAGLVIAPRILSNQRKPIDLR